MCGIVGARHDWLLARGLDPEPAMRDAVESLRWRGPDGAGVVRAGNWWLGCARLAIGPKNSRQPLVRRGGRFVCVMNGAITNARALWTHLRPGIARRSVLPNDAWLPLLAVEQRNDWCLWNLHGHHAYAVIDASTGDAMLGRDRHGEKPMLCIVERVGGQATLVAFASTPVALQHLGVTRSRATAWLAEWFRFGWTPERTQRVDSRHRVETVSWCGPQLARAGSNEWASPWPDDDAIRQGFRTPRIALREALCASVARCVDTPVPVALSLSGGLDSSCLAVALSEIGRRVPVYQLQADGASGTERAAAEAVAAQTKLELRRVDVGPEALDALPRLIACAGQPLGDPSVLAVHALARAAAGDGIRVLLGGEGADEMFLGYRRYRALAKLPLHVPALQRFVQRWSMSYPARWVRAVAAPDPITALLAVTPPAFGEAVLVPSLASRPCWRDDYEAQPRPHRNALRFAPPHADRLEQAARLRDLYGYLRCDLLPKVDVATMAAGVEARCPYLEGDYLRADRDKLGKRALLVAFGADLPTPVLRLPKTGFALPLDRWFRGELPWLDLLAEPRTQQRPHLRPGGVAKVVDMHRRGRADLGHGLYLLVAYETYLRTLDQENSAPRRTVTPPAT